MSNIPECPICSNPHSRREVIEQNGVRQLPDYNGWREYVCLNKIKRTRTIGRRADGNLKTEVIFDVCENHMLRK